MNRLNQARRASQVQAQIKQETERGVYNYVADKVKRGDMFNPESTITEGYLRLERDLDIQNAIEFDILTNQGTPNVTERRLNISDAFVVTHLGFAIYHQAEEPLPFTRVAAPLETYDNPSIYGNASGVQSLWNGSLSIRVNQVVYFDRYDLYRFYRVGQAQRNLEVSTGATQPAYFADEWNDAYYNFARITPTITLGGKSNNEIEVDLGTSVDLTPGNLLGNTVTAVLLCRGLLVQNAFKN